jgi:excisionase family DNA binding protein
MSEELEEAPVAGEVMDVEAVAAYLGFSSSTIYTKVRDFDIPHVRLGGVLRFPKVEIDRWLSRNTVRPQESFYNYFTQIAGHFFFERWLESRGLDLEKADPNEVADIAKSSLTALRDYKAESESYVD